METAKRVAKAVEKQLAPPKKGETFELRKGLVSQYASERKDSIQRTIAAMTIGKDVSALFPGMIATDFDSNDRCPEEHCNSRSRSKEACISLSHELCACISGLMYTRCQYIRTGF